MRDAGVVELSRLRSSALLELITKPAKGVRGLRPGDSSHLAIETSGMSEGAGATATGVCLSLPRRTGPSFGLRRRY